MARRDLPEKSAAGWPIVCVQELRDLWVAGPGPVLGVALDVSAFNELEINVVPDDLIARLAVATSEPHASEQESFW